MTLMHDPCQHSKGKRITKRSRPHRRRSNSSSFGKAKAPKATKESNQSQFMSEDSLEFCNHREKSMPQSACEIPPLNAQNLSSKGSSPTFIKNDSRNEGKRQTALAVDTRFVETLRDTGLPQNIIHNIQTLLDKAELRGVAPSVMSISQPHLTQKSLSGIRVHSYSPCMTSKKRAGLEPIYIPTETLEMANLEKQETTNSTGVVVQLPKLFSAKASWKLFGDYVVSVLHSPLFQASTPCNNLTVLTNDMSFLSDTRAVAHKQGLDLFWDRCKPFFLSHELNSIEIVVLWTHAEVIDTKDTDDIDSEEKRDENSHECRGDVKCLRTSRQTAIAELVSTFNQQLLEKGEEEFRANRSCIQFDATRHIPSIVISVSTVENSSLGMMSLLREWSRKDVPGPQRVILNFPDTSDTSDRNKIALDASYKTIPFALDSNANLGLQNDLKLIAQSKLEVIKSVSIESIDASLLYGVPIRLRSGLQLDMESHQKMVQMVQSLFHHMSKKEHALIVTSSPNLSTGSTNSVVGLFHQPMQKHTFVLMAEEIPLLLRHSIIPSTGILMRLATSDQFVEEVGAFDAISSIGENKLNFYCETIEKALDDSIAYTNSNPWFNPLYISALEGRHVPSGNLSNYETSSPDENIEMDSEDKWNDNSGVGSSEAAFNAAQTLFSGEPVPVQSGAHQGASRNQTKRTSTEKPEFELAEDDASGLQQPRNTNHVPLSLDHCQFPRARTGETAEADEMEWTDDEGIESSGVGVSPNSDKSDGDKEPSVGVFEYSD